MTEKLQHTDRRDFLKNSALAGAAALTASSLSGLYADGSDEIRVGLVGCGGRGKGAAQNVCDSATGVKIVAIGDAFEYRTKEAHQALSNRLGNKWDVPQDRTFVGLDAYKQVIDSPEVNYIILATPPGFRPIHIEYTVNAGKNLFTEKPVGVDGPGIRKVLDAYETAKKKGLAIVAGTQRRHQKPYIETIKQIQDGAIGDITSARAYWNGSGIWFRPREDWMSDAEYQINNWYHFLWVCGDHIVEQHIHNLDVINWIMGTHPVKARGMGGRMNLGGNSNRREGDPNEVGNIFDHFAVEFFYPGEVHMLSECRHIPNCWNRVGEDVVGTKGMSVVDQFEINGKKASSGGGNNPYVQEHTDLIESIRKGEPLNELKQVAESTMTAILGRMSTYTGREITWEQALNSKLDTFPDDLTMKSSLKAAPVPVPGKSRRV